MDKFSAHQVINGTWGKIQIDGTYMAEVTAFEAKVTLDKTELQVTVKGNTNCLSGKVIKVEDSLTKIVGSFYIESDEHEWSYGQHRTTMNLKF